MATDCHAERSKPVSLGETCFTLKPKLFLVFFFFVFERIRIGRIAAIYIHDMLSDKQLFVLELDECSFN